jgi:carbon monoxide dehydrogenase subunit G
MKIAGSYQFNTSAPKVWAVLTDIKALARCIPGCEGLDPIGNDEYQAVMTVVIGPIKGRYNAKISMRDLVPHESYRLVVQGTGTGGFVNGDAVITLIEENGKTTVRVDGDSQVGGAVARVGQRMMDSVAKMMMDRFFDCLQKAAS